MQIHKNKLLIIEDEADLNAMIVHHLKAAGFSVVSAFNGEQALEFLERDRFSLILLDILLPGIDGWELCRHVRSRPESQSTPIIIISALSSEADRIKGFDIGCDDFLIKPFSPREMVSRVKAILRREATTGKEKTTVSVGNIAIDFLNHQIRVKGEAVHLTNSEFRLLQLLMTEEGRVYTRDELLALMRENNFDLELGNVDVHVHHLRKKLEENPKKPKHIQTVWGVGYRFVRA